MDKSQNWTKLVVKENKIPEILRFFFWLKKPSKAKKTCFFMYLTKTQVSEKVGKNYISLSFFGIFFVQKWLIVAEIDPIFKIFKNVRGSNFLLANLFYRFLR